MAAAPTTPGGFLGLPLREWTAPTDRGPTHEFPELGSEDIQIR
jgi:hypothetical protein